jgi:CheY-like chemotaxis protein
MDLLTAKTVLVAEDDDFTRRVLAAVLTRMGARVIESTDGQKALTILNERRVDITLLDVLMPQVNGLCVLQAIRAGVTLQDFAMPAILLTATRDEACVHFAAALSCNGFLLKPINRADLAGRLSKIITQQMAMPYKPQHYRKIDVGPPDQPPRMPAASKRGLLLGDLAVGMVFTAPVISKGLTIAPEGTRLTAELLTLLGEFDRVSPLEPMFVGDLEGTP